MAPKWSRVLFFPEQARASTPIWDRPPTRGPIFVDSVPSPTEMWDRPPTAAPMFPDPLPSPEPMWNRDPSHVPMCPCCIFGIPPPPPGVPVMRPETAKRPSTSASIGVKSLRKMPSSVGLRLKRSIKNLRRRASDESV